MAGPEQNQNNEYDRAYAGDGTKSPLPAVWPDRKTAHKGYKNEY